MADFGSDAQSTQTETSRSIVDRIQRAFNSRETSELVADAIGVQVWATDLNGRMIRANTTWLEAHDFTSMNEVIGKTAHELLDPVLAATSVTEDLRVVDSGEASTSVVLDGSGQSFQSIRMPLIESDELVGIVGVITPQEVSVDEDINVVSQDEIDPLTGASNREALHIYVTEVLETGQDMSMLLLDLDDFHVVNTSLGREIGDQLLQKAAKRLITVFGARLYRVSGDGFVVMLPTVEAAQLDVVTEQILQRWRQPLIVQGTEIYGGVSIGIAPLGDQTGSEQVFQDAEMALRKAKDTGRNRAVVFDPSQRKAADEVLWQQMLVRRAVASKEFILHWQPIFEIATGEISGVEALLRWQPNGGLSTRPAAEFIPFLEHSGLVIPVGKQVIEDACRQQNAWRAMDKIARPVPIHVNVSRRQFTSGSLVADILTTMQHHGVDPRSLTIEVADFSPTGDQTKFLEDIVRLQKAGVRVAIDDFGSGWSALAGVADLPIQVTKVARSITGRIVEGQDEPLLDSIQHITRSLGHEAIVQGVENGEQLDWLRAKGWTHAQGYHLAEPLDPSEMTQMLIERLD